MREIAIIETAEAAAASLGAVRSQILAALDEPGSATTLAARVGLPRQKVNYHVRELERHGLVELVEERKKGNMTERVMRATAHSFLISPSALDAVAPDPRRGIDRWSANWMLAVAGKLVQDLGTLITRAAEARQPLATYTIDSELTFVTASDRAAFVAELSAAVAVLVDRYGAAAASPARADPTGRLIENDARTSRAGRAHRLVVALHPTITTAGTARHNRRAEIAALSHQSSVAE